MHARVGGERGTGDLADTGKDLDDAGREAASSISLPRCRIDSEASSAGFTITVFPVASAGASFQPRIISGEFHGTIAAITPTGSRRV